MAPKKRKLGAPQSPAPSTSKEHKLNCPQSSTTSKSKVLKKKYTGSPMSPMLSERVRQALSDILNNKTSIREAAKNHDISYSYLQRRVSGQVDLDRRNGPPTVFSKDEEESMARWLNEMSEKGMEPRPSEFLNFVQYVVRKEKRDTPFTDDRPSHDWYKCFKARNSHIIQMLDGRAHFLTKGSRSKCSKNEDKSSSTLYSKYREFVVKELLEKPKHIPVYNDDEKGFSLGGNAGNVIGLNGDTAQVPLVTGGHSEQMTSRLSTGGRRKVLIDCDPGNDDAMAILMALSHADVEVVAITCVEGNTNLKQAGLNALRTLQAANRLDIPVFLGSYSPLLGVFRSRTANIQYHGRDGFGDIPDLNAPGADKFQTVHGVAAMIRIANQYAGQLELVAIGPLTNVALAIRMDQQFGTRLKSCSIMGGNYQGRGNVSAAAEFNFYFDPEAANITVNELKCPITIVPWETCLKQAISWDLYHAMRNMGTPKADFIKKADTQSVAFGTAKKLPKFVPADEALMACFLNPAVITDSVHVYATIEMKGDLTWGQVVVDWQGLLGKAPNVTIVTEMNQNLYEAEMANALKN